MKGKMKKITSLMKKLMIGNNEGNIYCHMLQEREIQVIVAQFFCK